MEVDARRYEMKAHGQTHSLTPRELKLLSLFRERPGSPCPAITCSIKHGGSITSAPPVRLTNHVAQLRKKVESDPSDPRFLITVHGVGYRWADEELADQSPEFLQVAGDGREGILLGLVLEDGVSTVLRLLENPDQATHVGGHLLALLVPEFDLELNGRRIGSGPLEGFVGVLVDEISGVQVDREPGGVDPFHDRFQTAGIHQEIMVFQGEDDPFLARPFAGLVQVARRVVDGLLLGNSLGGLAGEDPDDGTSDGRVVVDPKVGVVMPLLEFGTVGEGEGVAYRAAAGVEPVQVRALLFI